MKKFILFFCFVLFSTNAFAQLALDENFDYPAGDSLFSVNNPTGWVRNTGSFNEIYVTTPGLVYAGYPLSNIGNAVTLSKEGYDAYKNLTVDSIKTGSVYASFMVRVDTARSGNYFFALLQSGSPSNYEGRVHVNGRAGDGTIAFGITKGNSSSDTAVAGIWTPSVYSLNTTYLLVMKYTFNPVPPVPPQNGNDFVSLFVFESGLPAIEPVPTVGPIQFTGSFDATAIGRVAIRQGLPNSSPNCVVDGIRVATSWFSTVMNIKLAIQGLVDANTSTMTRIDTVEVYLRNSTTPYAIIDSGYIAVDPVSLTGRFEFRNAPTGNYYLDVRYRHLPVFRNGIETWSANGIPFTKYNGTNYDFTNAANKAYGDNQSQIGSIFAMFNGDVNQDGFIGNDDVGAVDNDAFNFVSAYINTDCNGNNFVGADDLAIVDNNAFSFVSKVTPP